MSRKNGDISTQNQKKKERERKKGSKKEIKLWKLFFKKNSVFKKGYINLMCDIIQNIQISPFSCGFYGHYINNIFRILGVDQHIQLLISKFV
jgi:hypothetical protein